MKTKKRKPLPLNKKLFAKEYAKTGNGMQSVMKVEPKLSKEAAKVKASRMITDDNVIAQIEEERESLIDALERHGVNSDMVAKEVKNLITAESPIYKNNNKTGKLEFKGMKPDFQARDKGITHVVKIRGDYAPEKHLFRGKIDFGSLNELTNEQLDRIINGTEAKSLTGKGKKAVKHKKVS